MPAIIEIKNLSVRYASSPALNDVSLTIDRGDFVGLAGPNGAGKSTLVKTLLGLVPFSAGAITLFGKPLNTFQEWNKIGYLPQKSANQNYLFPASVEEVVTLGRLSLKKSLKIITQKDRQAVAEILEKLEIARLKDKLFSELSGGEQQRVILARSLVSAPEILILDEPSTALDPQSRENFFSLLQKLNTENKTTILLITHDIGYIGKYAEKLLYLDKNLIYYGSFSDFCLSKKMSDQFGEFDQHLICHQHDHANG